MSVRPRSALGLKYVELIPGRSKKTFQDGDTIPLVARHPERARARGRALHLPAAHARRRAEVARGLRRLDRRPRRGDQHDDPRARAVHALPAAGDAQPVEPEDGAEGLLPGPRRRGRAGGAGRGGAGGVALATWPPPSPRSRATPRRSARRSRRARRRCRRRPSRSASRRRSWRASPRCRATSSRARRCCPTTLPLINSRAQRGRARPSARRLSWASDLEDLFRAAEDLGDNPNTLLALKDLRTGACT